MIAQILVEPKKSGSPTPPRYANLWLDPALLQLVGLGTKDDPYLPDGHHLRWFFGRLLGFPRTGFVLGRRRSLLDLDSEELEGMFNLMGFQFLTSDELDTDVEMQQFQSGLTVRKQGGFVYGSAQFNSSPALVVDGSPILLEIGQQSDADEIQLPTNPAAYVLLVVARKEKGGYVEVNGYSNDGDKFQLQDTARSGSPPTQVMDVRRGGMLGRVADRVGGRLFSPKGTVADRPDWQRAVEDGMEFKEPAGCLPLGTADDWVVETLLLHGGLLEHIEVTGSGAVVGKIQWLPSRLYAGLDGWETTGTFFLPLTGSPQIYPNWTDKTGEKVASERLSAAPPRAQAPWDEPAHPPPPAPAWAIAADLKLRYLGDSFERVRLALETFLAGEILFQRPQALIELPETLHWEGTNAPADSAEMLYQPFDFLYNSAVDPNMARLLGLMTSDTQPPGGHWDYLITAGFPFYWILLALVPSLAHLYIEYYKTHGIEADGSFEASGLSEQAWQKMSANRLSQFGLLLPVASLATGIREGHAPLPAKPREVKATSRPQPGPTAVQAEVEVSWRVGSDNLFLDPQHAQVFYALRRKDGSHDVSVNRRDEELNVPLPHVPSAESVLDKRARMTDRSLEHYGAYTWLVSGMDIWGRFSPYAEAAATVKDEIAPPAPTKLTAELIGETDLAPTWQSLIVSFDWTSTQRQQAPDLAVFELHVRQGKISKLESQAPQTWGRLEHTANATTQPLRIAWPTGAVTPLGGGLTQMVIMEPIPPEKDDPPGIDKGTRWTISLGPINRPFDAAGFAQISATLRAVDAAGNASPFASHAVATRADDTPPPAIPLLPGPQRSSYPDARARAFFRLPLKTPAGMLAQVMRAPEVALLRAGNDAGAFEKMNVGQKVEHLKKLAMAHAEVFTADHEIPYDDSFTDHLLELNGNDRGWTVATLQHISKTGVRAGWPAANPDCFVVVSVRAAVPPPVPLVREARPGDRQASLYVAPDPSGRTKTVRVYRTRDLKAAADVRSMRLVMSANVSGPGEGLAKDLLLTDKGLLPDVTYHYCIVAIGEENVRSAPTRVIPVRPFSSQPPEKPQVISVKRPSPASELRFVKWRISRRDYRVTLFRRVSGGASWELTAAAVSGDGSLQLSALSTVQTAAGYEVSLTDKAPDAKKIYSYFVRVTDPRGRRADSAPVEEGL